MRPKNGALHPVSPRKVTSELSQKYDIIFVHQNSDYQNYIGIRHTAETSAVYNKINTTPELIAEVPKITSVQQIGNTLFLITGEGIWYLLYNERAYKSLGVIPEMRKIEWYASYGQVTKYFYDEYSSIKIENFKEAAVGLFNTIIENLNTKGYSAHPTRREEIKDGEMCLVDAHLSVFAFRLYDGSTIKQSSPVLLCPPAQIGLLGLSVTYGATGERPVFDDSEYRRNR